MGLYITITPMMYADPSGEFVWPLLAQIFRVAGKQAVKKAPQIWKAAKPHLTKAVASVATFARSLSSAATPLSRGALEGVIRSQGSGQLIKNISKSLISSGFAQQASDIAMDVLGGGENSVFSAGMQVFDNFDIDTAYVKPKHLSTTSGNGRKFLGATKYEAETILKDAMRTGAVTTITNNGLTMVGNQSYQIVIDAGKTIGTRGEHLIQIVLSSDGGMLSAYPIQ